MQNALLNPFSLVQQCIGPKLFKHIKHIIICLLILAIIVIGAPVFNAILPFFRCA